MSILKSIIFFLISIIFFATSYSQNYTGEWQELAEMDTGRYNFGACVYDEKIYVFGGTIGQGSGSPATASVEVYDPKENIWIQETRMTSPRTHTSVCVLNDTIYVIGGAPNESVSPLRIVETYDPITKVWGKRKNMPTAKMNTISITYNGKIYTIGGQDKEDGIRNLEEYDPTTNEWTRRANMKEKRAHLVACEVNDKFYALGGGSYSLINRTIEEYDPLTNSWEEKSPMEAPRTSAAGCAMDSLIVVIGGSRRAGQDLDSKVEVYNTVSDEWTKMVSLPGPRVALAAVAIGDSIYAIAGSERNWPFNPCCKLEVFNFENFYSTIQKPELPVKFTLHQNYPNPFNSSTTIEFKMPMTSNVKISVYDINGKLIEELINEHRSAGSSFVTWNPVKIPSGVYFYRVKAGDFSDMKKCILIK